MLSSATGEFSRGVIAIGLFTGVAVLGLSLFFLLVFSKPAPQPAPVNNPAPTVAVTDYRYYLENPEDYYAGKCLVVSEDAAPEAYAAHPGIQRCKFKQIK